MSECVCGVLNANLLTIKNVSVRVFSTVSLCVVLFSGLFIFN